MGDGTWASQVPPRQPVCDLRDRGIKVTDAIGQKPVIVPADVSPSRRVAATMDVYMTTTVTRSPPSGWLTYHFAVGVV